MLLHDHMRDAVADVHADTDRLTGAARALGGRTRRRRRVAAIGTAAAVSVLAAGIAFVSVDAGPAPAPPVATDPSDSAAPSPSPSPDETAQKVPIDGRSVTAALREAVLAVQPGQTTAYAGQNPSSVHTESYATFELTPASGGGAGPVGLNLQEATILDGNFGCTYAFMLDCTSRELPGGGVLTTYREQQDPAADPAAQRLVAQYVSPARNLRVVATAANGFEGAGNEWDITREEPVLSTAQLAEVVTAEWWGFELPARFAAEGAELEPYEDISTTLYATPTGDEQ